MPQKIPQLLKYIGNKAKFSEAIVKTFPRNMGTYFEPFFGSGAVLGAAKPKASVAVDAHAPLIELWQLVQKNPNLVLYHYTACWERYSKTEKAKKEVYSEVLASYNNRPNGLDLMFICRSCYGGVLRYRKADGYLSTPVGAHLAIPPSKFEKRLRLWSDAVKNTDFIAGDFSQITNHVKEGDVVYCDPPYVDSQKILYGAQDFQLARLIVEIKKWKERGAFVALSIDGSKFSGEKQVDLGVSFDVFEDELEIELGGSMLKRFQLREQNTAGHRVTDRLLLTSSAGKTEQLQLLV
jgi:DNA adenine methylase